MHRHRLSNPELDQWAPVVKAQVQANLASVEEEVQLKQLNRQLYKDELERQLFMKRQQQHAAATDRQAEIEQLRRKVQAVQEFDLKYKEDTRQLQQRMAKDYALQSTAKAQLLEGERAEELASERARLQKLEAEMAQERELQRALKEKTVLTEKETLERKLKDHQEQTRSKRTLQTQDQDLVRASMENMLRKEQEWRDRMAAYQRKIEHRTNAFDAVRQANEDRKFADLQRERGWDDTVARRTEELVGERQRDKQSAMKSTYETIAQQIQHNELRQSQLLREKEREREEVKLRQKLLKLEEEKRKQLHLKEQELLKETLAAQVIVQKERAIEPFRMNDKEKRLNMNFLTESPSLPTFYGVPGASTADHPLKKVLPLAFKGFSQQYEASPAKLPIELEGPARNFYGVSETPQPNSKRFFHLDFDPNKHDPIANPIGSHTSRSVDTKSFLRGRGMAALSSARLP